MKKYTLSAPLLVTAALAPVIAFNSGCGKKDSPRWDTPAAGTNISTVASNAVSAVTNNDVGTNIINAAASPASAATVTNAVTTTNAEVITPPTVMTNMAPAATPEPAAVASDDTNDRPAKPVVAKAKVVEMPETPVTAPDKFYNGEFSTNHIQLGHEQDYFFTTRAGYQHSGYGDNSDAWYGGFKFYAYPDMLRVRAGKNAWMIPDIDAEFSYQFLPKPDHTATIGTDEGLELRANAYWPWINWTLPGLAHENSANPLARPLHFTLGPVFSAGFEKTFDGSGIRFDRYGGARLEINRAAFIQYEYGKTDGIGHNRHEVLGEVPFYVSHDGLVRYVFRGEWSRGDLNLPDYYQLGAFVEMPVSVLVHPHEWHDLIPFTN
ncbi:MAG TPA: hypothetical protein VG347_11675 [Verrucomicrobiae bacterium]|nr:hypothetical protein [Verrucomicrobiae bacterium]